MAAPILDAAPSAAKGRGFLGSILHVLGQTGADLENVAINSPAGLYHLGGGLIHHPVSTVETIGKQTLQDLEHPLRHPGYTALDILGLVPGPGALIGRAAEVGRVAAGTSKLAEAGGEAVSAGRQLSQAILHGPPVPDRIISTINRDAAGKEISRFDQAGASFSRNPTIRAAQKLLDQVHEAHPEGVPGVWKSQTRRQASAAKQLLPIERGLSKAAAATLTGKYRNLPAEMHEAVTLVARGVLPKTQIEFLKGRVASGELKGRTLKEATAAIARTEKAAKFIEPYRFTTKTAEYTLPKIRDEHADLIGFKNDAKALADGRSQALNEAGQLTDKSEVVRTIGPKNIMEGHGLPENVGTARKLLAQLERLGRGSSDRALEQHRIIREGEGQMRLDDQGLVEGHIHDPELMRHKVLDEAGVWHGEWADGPMFRVPEVITPAARAVEGFTRRFKGANPRALGTLTHQYKGAVLSHGGGRWNVAETVAESYTEAMRFLTLKTVRQKLLASAQDSPAGIPIEQRLPIVVDYWKGKLPTGYQYPQRALEDHLDTSGEIEAAARWYEPLRQLLFEPGEAIKKIQEHLGVYDPAADQVTPGVKWIDKRQLGGLEKQNPLWSAMESGIVRKGLHTVDTINTLQKSMLLYLKPAYLLPNMLGNVALNLVQQGFLAPANMTKTLKILFTGNGLKPEAVNVLKQASGSGISQILESPKGIAPTVSRVSNKFANAYGKVIDDPFRLSAILHEARVEGFHSSAQLNALALDPQYADKLLQISGRANDAIINYERLGPGEQAILRRLVFFYPWVKGSSRYGYQLAINHPVTASFTGVTGQEGGKYIEDNLGALPSYAEGLIPYNTKNKDRPTVGNPLSFSILQQPAELAKMITNVVEHNPNPDLPLAGNLAPFDAAVLSLITAGKVSTIGHPASEAPYMTATHEAFGGNPIRSLVESLTGGPPRPGSLYPDNSPYHALLRYLATGGLTPRIIDKAKANEIAWKQKHPTGF